MTIHYASTERESYMPVDHAPVVASSDMLARVIAELQARGLRACGARLHLHTKTIASIVAGEPVKRFVLEDLAVRLDELDAARVARVARVA